MTMGKKFASQPNQEIRVLNAALCSASTVRLWSPYIAGVADTYSAVVESKTTRDNGIGIVWVETGEERERESGYDESCLHLLMEDSRANVWTAVHVMTRDHLARRVQIAGNDSE